MPGAKPIAIPPVVSMNERASGSWELEHIQRVAAGRRIDFGAQDAGRRSEITSPGRDREILFSADTERDRKPVDRCPETYLPEHLTRLNVKRFQGAVGVAHEDEAPGRGQGGRVEHGPLLVRPELLHRSHV